MKYAFAVVFLVALSSGAPAPAQDARRAGSAASSADDVAALVDQLAAADAKVRTAAASRLGRSYPDGGLAAPALLELLDDENAGVRGAARESICRLAAEALPDVAAAIPSAIEHDEWRSLYEVLANRPEWPGTHELVPGLHHAIKSDPSDRSGTATTLAVAAACFGPLGVDRSTPLRSIELVSIAAPHAAGDARRTVAAALSVLARAELIHRVYRDHALDLPKVDDEKAVAGVLALLTPSADDEPRAAAQARTCTARLLGWSYGRQGAEFRTLLQKLPESRVLEPVLPHLAVIDVSEDGPGPESFIEEFRSDPGMSEFRLVTALVLRREQALALVPQLEGILEETGDDRARLTAAVALTQLRPDHERATAELLQTLVLGLEKDYSRPDIADLQRYGRRTAWRPTTAAHWLARHPSLPPPVPQTFWRGMQRSESLEQHRSRRAVAELIASGVGSDPAFAAELRDAIWPDSGEPTSVGTHFKHDDALFEAVMRSAAPSDAMVAACAKDLKVVAKESAVDLVRRFGANWPPLSPVRNLRLLASAGPAAKSAADAIRPFADSEDLHLRYLARLALRRSGAE